ncbi:MAG: hypothetical protein ACI86X_002049 [Moritella sp.]|jgi:hypothetical protein
MLMRAAVLFRLGYISQIVFFLIFSGQALAQGSVYDGATSKNNFVAVSAQYEYSNNINLQSTNPTSGNIQNANVSVGYHIAKPATKLSLDYQANEYRYSEKTIENGRYWSGHAALNQQLFSKNITLDARHFRHRYLLDESEAELPNNKGDRGIFSIGPQWLIPYSPRAGFKLGYNYTTSNFSKEKEQDSDRNTANLAWYNTLNKKLSVQINSTFTQVEFPSYSSGYDKVTADVLFTGRLNRGDYSVQLGNSYVNQSEQKVKGLIYSLNYNYKFSRQSLSLGATRALTDSSLGLKINTESDGDGNFTPTQVIWRDRIELLHLYYFNARGVNNKVTLYFDNESAAFESNQQKTDETTQKTGITNQLNVPIDTKLSTSLSLGYRDSDLHDGGNKQQWRLDITGDYKIKKNLIFSLNAKYLNVNNRQRHDKYDEWRYISRITLKY